MCLGENQLKLPLLTHLLLTSKGEASHALVLDVGENGFDGTHRAIIKFSPERCIELPSHSLHSIVALASTLRSLAFRMLTDREQTLWCAIGLTKTSRASGTRGRQLLEL
jgi:hypothetical protein